MHWSRQEESGGDPCAWGPTAGVAGVRGCPWPLTSQGVGLVGFLVCYLLTWKAVIPSHTFLCFWYYHCRSLRKIKPWLRTLVFNFFFFLGEKCLFLNSCAKNVSYISQSPEDLGGTCLIRVLQDVVILGHACLRSREKHAPAWGPACVMLAWAGRSMLRSRWAAVPCAIIEDSAPRTACNSQPVEFSSLGRKKKKRVGKIVWSSRFLSTWYHLKIKQPFLRQGLKHVYFLMCRTGMFLPGVLLARPSHRAFQQDLETDAHSYGLTFLLARLCFKTYTEPQNY